MVCNGCTVANDAIATTLRRRPLVTSLALHRLHIERERYVGTRIEDRLYIDCNKIEDEIHFMFECQKYKLFRDDLMKVIKDSSMILTDDNKANLR